MSETSSRKPHLRPVGHWTDEEVTYRVTREMDGFADIFSSEDALEGVRQNAARAMDCTDRYEVHELLRSILRTATTILAVWRVRHIWDNPPKAEELIDDEAGPCWSKSTASLR
jgi:hypothetical protein